MKVILRFLGSIKIVLIAYSVITIAITLFQYYNTQKQLKSGNYTSYNNYIIFKKAYNHLVEQKNLYVAYPDEYWDLFKYSPLFALSMGTLAYLPDLPALAIWNLLNSLILFFAIKSLLFLSEKKRSFILLAILPELIINLQNSQSNALMAGLMIYSLSYFEKNKSVLAALMCVLAFSIKIYGGIAALLFIFYSKKIKFIAFSVLFTIASFIIPMLATSAGYMVLLLNSWLQVLKYDIDTSVGLSVMGWLQSWFNFNPNKNIVLLTGMVLLLLPLLKKEIYSNLIFRIHYMASIMIWVIIFNHRSESPTFIIAFAGAALWYFNSGKKTIETVLFILALILSSLSPTDLFPQYIRTNYIIPYVLKVIPFIAIWLYITIKLLKKTNAIVLENK